MFFRLVKTENQKCWIWIGIVAGIAFNTKYSVVFPLAGFFIAILFFQKLKLILTPWFIAGLVSGLLLILPNIFWQYNHNWPVLYHMQQLQNTQLTNLNFFHFFIDQYSLNSLLPVVWIFGLVMLIVKPGHWSNRFTALALINTFMLFIVMKGKAYYTMGLLPFLIAAGGFYTEKIIQKKLVYVPAMAVLTLFSLPSLPYVLPVISFEQLAKYSSWSGNRIPAPFIRWEDGKKHSFRRFMPI